MIPIVGFNEYRLAYEDDQCVSVDSIQTRL